MSTSEELLPSDLIFEILTRITSLKALDTCKSICKSWNKLIHEPRFMPLYCQRTRNLSGYFILDKDRTHRSGMTRFVSIDQLIEEEEKDCGSVYDVVYMEELLDYLTILASCNQGIFCCLRRRKYYYACKPASRQCQLLLNPEILYQTAAIAIMVLSSSPLRYKIVRLSVGCVEGDVRKYNSEIFDSKIWTWKETQYVTLQRDEFILRSSTTVSAGNSIYWLTSHDNVLAFHEPEGTFQKFPLPEEVVRDKNKYHYCKNWKVYKKLLDYQGRLGLIIICNTQEQGETELWITYENPRNCTNWREKIVMDKENIGTSVTHPSLAGLYNDAVAFLKAFYRFVLYTPEIYSLSRVKGYYNPRHEREIFRFRSDLEPVNLGGDGGTEIGFRW
ncbi:hypothetical protein BUALT_Bualt05G0025200 [Buddleja alternifolia]|uniref:F-box domain-containing protein n=1 Tax=Buddleja alternifolia TaxID=168488 RepID=A0AAV6XHW0_9LAMI|nr:hypothetical protein BUALT_Bualt05G0025200 [Buddleja alternifolia]